MGMISAVDRNVRAGAGGAATSAVSGLAGGTGGTTASWFIAGTALRVPQ